MSILIKNILHNQQVTNVFIQGNRFVKIGAEMPAADIIIDGTDKAILPGFYNTHNHAAMSILRGYGEDTPLFEWLNDYIWPVEAKLSEEDIYHASRLAILEMIKSGTVFFADMYYKTNATIKAVAEMGIRAAISAHQLDNFDSAKTLEQIAATQKFLSAANPCPDRIIKSVSCHSIYTVSEDLINYAVKISRENNYILMIHVSETIKEVEDCYQKYKMSPVEKLDSLGALSPRTIIAHAVHINDKDLELIKNSGSYISTNPTSNLKLNSGCFKFEKVYENIPDKITLGTDGASSNNNLSMIEAMKICSLGAKIEAGNAMAGQVSKIYPIATKNGAQAFGLDAGEIAEGKLADCILVDLNNAFLVPNYNLWSNLVYAADSSCVTEVICNGRVIMQDGIVANELEIIKSAQKLSKTILTRNYFK